MQDGVNHSFYFHLTRVLTKILRVFSRHIITHPTHQRVSHMSYDIYLALTYPSNNISDSYIIGH